MAPIVQGANASRIVANSSVLPRGRLFRVHDWQRGEDEQVFRMQLAQIVLSSHESRKLFSQILECDYETHIALGSSLITICTQPPAEAAAATEVDVHSGYTVLSICGDLRILKGFLARVSRLHGVKGPFFYQSDCTACSRAGPSYSTSVHGSPDVPWRMRGPCVY